MISQIADHAPPYAFGTVREFQLPPTLELHPFNLANLVRRTLRQCQNNLQAASVTVDAQSLEEHGEVVCLADDAEGRWMR